jgi:hypothetical protein
MTSEKWQDHPRSPFRPREIRTHAPSKFPNCPILKLKVKKMVEKDDSEKDEFEDDSEEDDIDVNVQKEAQIEESYLQKLEKYFADLEQKYGEKYAYRQKKRFILARRLKRIIELNESEELANANFTAYLERAQREQQELHEKTMALLQKYSDDHDEQTLEVERILAGMEKRSKDAHEKLMANMREENERSKAFDKILLEDEERLRELMALKKERLKKS